MYKCEECNLEFETFQAKANHHRWKHLGYIFKNKETKEKNKKHLENKWKHFIVICCKCGKEIKIKECNIDKPKREKYYCSKSCANGHIWTEESKLKQSNSIKKLIREGKAPGYLAKHKNAKLVEDSYKYCINCNKKIYGKHKIFCSKECRHNYRTKDYTNYQKYHLASQFTFSLNDYPLEFEFSLVEKYGWYKAKNHGNNLNGVSRDHMFSIKEGFLQNIDSKIISHPANCKLMRHNDNVSKYKKCSLTLVELINKIEEWNNKYASVAQLD